MPAYEAAAPARLEAAPQHAALLGQLLVSAAELSFQIQLLRHHRYTVIKYEGQEIQPINTEGRHDTPRTIGIQRTAN